MVFPSKPGRRPHPLGVNGYTPSWSPDGRTIAYGGARGIYTLNLRGGKPRLIRRTTAFVRIPIWSIRNQIAFDDDPDDPTCGASWEEGWWCTMRPGGRYVRHIRLDGHFPDWSPNGYRLVSVTDIGRANQVLIGCPNGRGNRQITTPVRYVRSRDGISDLAWSPDGRKITFTYKWDVYEIPANPPRPLPPSSWRKVAANAS